MTRDKGKAQDMRNACRPLGRFFCLLVVAAATLALPIKGQVSGPGLTQVVDNVYRADGTAATGTVLISWPAFTTSDGKAIAAGSVSVKLGAGGAFTASLVPNTGAQPAGVYYKVVYQLASQEPSSEYWVVPATGSTTIGAVRAKLMPPTIAAQVLTRDVAEGLFGHKSGADKKSTALTLVQNSILATDVVAGKDIVDPGKFQDGLGKVIDGVVQCLNSSAWSKTKSA
jgi:hypothetical protein